MSLTTIFDTKDSVFFVGGRGTKAGDADAGGGCIADLWGDLTAPSKALSDIVGANGGPLSDASAWNGSQTACVVSNNGSGKARITKNGAFSNCIVGLVANVVSTGVVPNDVNDRFEVTAVDPSGNYVDCNFDVSSGGTCDIKAGGAFGKIQTASDETTASSATLAHNVDILTNKAETFSAAGDQIDIDTGGGDKETNTWKRVIGVDSDGVKLAAGSYNTIDADGQAAHVFTIDNVSDISFHHIHAYNQSAAKYGFYFDNSSAQYGLSLIECKASGGGYGVKTVGSNVRNFTILGGAYEGTTAAIIIQNILGGTIQRADVCSSGTYAMYVSYYGISIYGCTIRSDGTGYGINLTSTNHASVVNNIFYNVTDGIKVDNASTTLIEYNNIFMVAAAATGKAINRTAGSITHSDYSCMWAIDGAPAAADRWGGDGIGDNSIEADPQLEDAANDDFRLKLSSPCLRTGRPTLGQL
jgi:hypothetical protein